MADNSVSSKNDEDDDMVELSRIYKVLNDDAKLIVQDLQYSSKALRGTSFFLFFLAGGSFLLSAGALTYLHTSPGIGFGYFLLVIGCILGGVAVKFYLDYYRMKKRYRRLFALFMRV